MARKNDKRETEIENKKSHKARLKQRGLGPIQKRQAPTRTEKPIILIVCEGENTEKSYFNQFRLSSARIKAVGQGYNTTSLVNEAIRLDQEGKYDQVWCVFDKDDFAAQDFNSAITIAQANNFKVAYSNQAFEYWILLHFEDHQGSAMPRSEYNKAINEHLEPLDAEYDGEDSKIITEKMFELMEACPENGQQTRREVATARAQAIYNRYTHHSPATEESSTTVHNLVLEIQKYI
jgi:hypothetical protein